METKFKRGNKVKLISGGPVMTADEYDEAHDVLGMIRGSDIKPSQETEYLWCEWFEKNKPIRRKFHQDMLELVT